MIEKVKRKISNFLSSYILDEASKRFIKHNRKIWGAFRQQGKEKAEVLFELNGMSSAIIAYSYLANNLAEKYQARIVAYSEYNAIGWKWLFQKIFKNNTKKIFKSFNVRGFVNLSLNRTQKIEASVLFDEVYPQLKTKNDVEQLIINGVLIGDLVYDTYLRHENVPTVNLSEKKFIDSLKNTIEIFVFWKNYLDSHNVKAINVSHCVYNLAIPLRIAVSRGLPVYQINATHAYRLSENNLLAYNDFKKFPEYFSRLSKNVQDAGLREAKKRLERRFSGEVGVDMDYSSKSAYSGLKKKTVLRKSKKIKILIATHCFFDSPHPYGYNLFPDFYEWLSFLGRISEKTDYDWYIKTHPDFLPGNEEILEKIIEKYPKFTLIPADTSHKQIIQEGINYALTVYGTIGFEYAALGVPVINASMCNPHVAYNFNFHPETVEQYKDVLMGLDDQEILIDKQQVYEYYFMRHIYNTENIFFNSYDKTIEELGGYKQQFTPAVYEKWLDEWSPEKHLAINSAIRTFIQSGDFRMDYTHYGREFTVDSIGAKA